MGKSALGGLQEFNLLRPRGEEDSCMESQVGHDLLIGEFSQSAIGHSLPAEKKLGPSSSVRI